MSAASEGRGGAGADGGPRPIRSANGPSADEADMCAPAHPLLQWAALRRQTGCPRTSRPCTFPVVLTMVQRERAARRSGMGGKYSTATASNVNIIIIRRYSARLVREPRPFAPARSHALKKKLDQISFMLGSGGGGAPAEVRAAVPCLARRARRASRGPFCHGALTQSCRTHAGGATHAAVGPWRQRRQRTEQPAQ